MANPRLHVVDSDGETTTHPLGGAEPPSSDPPSSSTGAKRAPARQRPRFVVPTDRMTFDMQIRALNVVTVASRGGQEPVDAKRMAALLNISPATAPLNNAFFIDVNLMTKIGKGDYVPTELAVKFQQKHSFNPGAAPSILAPGFQDSWFYKSVCEAVAIGDTTRDSMIQTLASVAGTDASYATQYGLCLRWLEYVGLIRFEDGIIRLVHGPASPAAAEPIDVDADIGDADGGLEGVTEQLQVGEESRRQTPTVPQRGPAVISLSFAIDVTVDDLAKLQPEQISALFEGVGKIAAVKAALDSQ